MYTILYLSLNDKKAPKQLPNCLKEQKQAASFLIVFSGVLYHVGVYSVAVSFSLLRTIQVPEEPYVGQ